MKRTVCLIMALILSFGLIACTGESGFGENVTCEAILSAAQSVGEYPDAEKIYLKSSDNLDTYSMSLWADGTFEECAELDLLSDYAIYMSAGTTTYEVSVLKAKDSEGVEQLKALLERRKTAMSLGDKGMYDPDFDAKMDNSVIYTDGLFVMLIITDDNDAVLEAVKGLK